MLTRRVFLGSLTGGLLAAPLAAEAQDVRRTVRIGFISTASPGRSPANDAFQQELLNLGYVEGRNIVIEWRWGQGRTEQVQEFVAELVKLKVDVIVAANDIAGQAARRATTTIPVVVAIMGDPVGSGLVASLSRPGGNVTGLTSQSPDLVAKRLQLLKEAVPGASLVGVLADANDVSYRLAVREVEGAARTLGVSLRLYVVTGPRELNGAFASVAKAGVGAVLTRRRHDALRQ